MSKTVDKPKMERKISIKSKNLFTQFFQKIKIRF